MGRGIIIGSRDTHPTRNKFKGKCHVCSKYGNPTKDYHEGFVSMGNKSKENKVQVNLTKDVIITIALAVNMASNSVEWVVDFGATGHICTKRDLF